MVPVAGCHALARCVGQTRALWLAPLPRAIHGAGATAALLELARLKGWNVAGLRLDYVKCFDMIPQAVVLRVARDVGMDHGTLRALPPMYGQPRSAFRLAGSLGEWWRATNGIL